MRPNKCKRLVKNEKNNYDDADICTYDGIEPIVCCPTTEDEIIKVPKTNFINSTADRSMINWRINIVILSINYYYLYHYKVKKLRFN